MKQLPMVDPENECLDCLRTFQLVACELPQLEYVGIPLLDRVILSTQLTSSADVESSSREKIHFSTPSTPGSSQLLNL